MSKYSEFTNSVIRNLNNAYVQKSELVTTVEDASVGVRVTIERYTPTKAQMKVDKSTIPGKKNLRTS